MLFRSANTASLPFPEPMKNPETSIDAPGSSPSTFAVPAPTILPSFVTVTCTITVCWRTPVVFVLIAAAAWYVIERVFFRALLAGRPVPVKLVVGFTVFLSLGTLAGFAFSMRGISAERQSDMLVGTTWAVLSGYNTATHSVADKNDPYALDLERWADLDRLRGRRRRAAVRRCGRSRAAVRPCRSVRGVDGDVGAELLGDFQTTPFRY